MAAVHRHRALHHPSHEHLVGVGVYRDLRRTGGAAGVEVAGAIRRRDGAAARQPVGRFGGERAIEIEPAHPAERPLGGVRGLEAALEVLLQVDLQHRLERRHRGRDRRHLLPQVAGRRRRQRHQHLGPGRAQDVRDMRGLEHRVDRAYNAGCLAAPDRVMRLRQVRQHVGHDVLRVQCRDGETGSPPASSLPATRRSSR